MLHYLTFAGYTSLLDKNNIIIIHGQQNFNNFLCRCECFPNSNFISYYDLHWGIINLLLKTHQKLLSEITLS